MGYFSRGFRNSACTYTYSLACIRLVSMLKEELSSLALSGFIIFIPDPTIRLLLSCPELIRPRGCNALYFVTFLIDLNFLFCSRVFFCKIFPIQFFVSYNYITQVCAMYKCDRMSVLRVKRAQID